MPWAGMFRPFRPFGSTYVSLKHEFCTAETVHNVHSSEQQKPQRGETYQPRASRAVRPGAALGEMAYHLEPCKGDT